MPTDRTKDLVVIDGSNDPLYFPVVEEGGRQKITFHTRPYQPEDPRYPFRKSIFPMDGGVGRDRLSSNARTYAKMNGDVTFPGSFRHPPRLNTVTLTNGNNPFQFKAFDDVIFILGGRYMYYVDPATNTSTEDKDFGVGKAAVSMEVFNNELVVAMGESEKIWTRSAAGVWTQATDNTFAIAFGVVDSKLYRGEEVNQLSNAITAPMTLTSWVPSDGNEYTVGDTTYAIHTIVDFQGAVWVGKGDGMYAADPTFVFHNQTPQIKSNPHADNCKGAWVAHSSLWVPFVNGLLRIRLGSSLPYGPEITWRRDYRYWTRGGVEHNGNIYIIVTDEADVGETTIYKMVPLDLKRSAYTYHEWARLGNTTNGLAITASSKGTNPEIFVTHGNDVKYLKLGRGGGADIDDTNYEYGTAAEVESGRMMAGSDLSILTCLVGIEVVCDYSAANESLTAQYALDGGAYANFLTTQEGGGTAAITNTTNIQSVRRYAATDAECQLFEIKLASTLVTQSATPEVFDAIVFGYMRPLVTDEVTVAIDGSDAAWSALGLANGMDAMGAYLKFRQWMNADTQVVVRLDRYDDGNVTRFLVTDVQYGQSQLTTGENVTPSQRGNIVVTMVRVPYGVSEYAA
jgi:hypothetical protein